MSDRDEIFATANRWALLRAQNMDGHYAIPKDDLDKLRADLAEAQLQARQWHEAFDRTMADYHTVNEQLDEFRVAADLLARVRRECRIDVTETGVEGVGVLIGITITGMDRDGMRELAEALKPRCSPD